MIRDIHTLLTRILSIHAEIRNGVIQSCESATSEQLATIVSEQAGDTIFAIDRISEEILLHHFERLGEEWSFVLIAEGLGEDGEEYFPPESIQNRQNYVSSSILSTAHVG